MAGCKTVIVGGGSFHWGPGLIRDFLVTPELAGGTLVLYDIDREAAEKNLHIAELMRKKTGIDMSLEVAADRRAALADADYVVLTIAVGGLDAWQLDMDIPDRYGCRQTIADTVGPGGLSRALRNIPVVVDLAREMEEVCPDAWLLNLTNPMTTLTRAVWRETSIPCLGLCHEAHHFLRGLEETLGSPADEMRYTIAGINHCVWMLDLDVNGQDGIALLRRHWQEKGLPKDTVGPLLLEIFGILPVGKGRHLSEFFPHFLTPAAEYGGRYGFLDQMVTVKDRRESREKAHARWLKMLDGEHLPELAIGGEPVVPIILARELNRREVLVINWPNLGQIDNLPREAVVETMAVVDRRGVHPLAAGALPDSILGITTQHVANQERIVEAGVEGDYQAALQALFNDPLVNSLEDARAMLDELLQAHKQYLPQFDL